MNTASYQPVITADAGDPAALSDPNSPASIMKKAKEQEAQSNADTKYDTTPPPRIDNFTDWVEIQWDGHHKSQETITGMFLALSVLLFLYAAAPSPN